MNPHTTLTPYNPLWPKLFISEAALIAPIFGDALLGIEHIGSTAIPGLPAKPIIDIMVLINSHEDVERFLPALAEIGYPFNTARHTESSTERHFFRKGEPTQFHLSIAYQSRGSFWNRQLAFRDYLRTHPDDRDAYATLKATLMQQDPTGGDAYIAGKTDLVNNILDKAGFVRWQAGA